MSDFYRFFLAQIACTQEWGNKQSQRYEAKLETFGFVFECFKYFLYV